MTRNITPINSKLSSITYSSQTLNQEISAKAKLKLTKSIVEKMILRN